MFTTLMTGVAATWQGDDEIVDTLTDFFHRGIGGTVS
jgi:hypothetical protein